MLLDTGEGTPSVVFPYMQTVCKKFKTWLDQHPEPDHPMLSFNLQQVVGQLDQVLHV